MNLNPTSDAEIEIALEKIYRRSRKDMYSERLYTDLENEAVAEAKAALVAGRNRYAEEQVATVMPKLCGVRDGLVQSGLEKSAAVLNEVITELEALTTKDKEGAHE